MYFAAWTPMGAVSLTEAAVGDGSARRRRWFRSGLFRLPERVLHSVEADVRAVVLAELRYPRAEDEAGLVVGRLE